MALWQMDIIGGAFLASGREAKVITGVDDHSRYCVICQVVPRATGRAVCLAFAGALRKFGVPAEVLTDNGKQFTDRFGHGGETLFDRICRDNGITHLLTPPRTPTTTGKIERFHGSLREMMNDGVPFADLTAVQAAADAWVAEYNTPGRIRASAWHPRWTGSRQGRQGQRTTCCRCGCQRSSRWSRCPRRLRCRQSRPSRCCDRGRPGCL